MKRSSAGFTLVELMVALAVAGLVVTTAVAGLSVISDAVARSRANSQAVMSGATARRQLEHWLRSATLLEGAGSFHGIHRRDGAGLTDEVSFVVADGGALYPGPHRIRLWVERDQRKNNRGLLVALTPLNDSRLRTDTLVLAYAATGVGLQYLDAVANRWTVEWREDGRLPRAVQVRVESVTVTRLDPGGGSQQMSAVPPLLTHPLVVPIEMETW